MCRFWAQNNPFILNKFFLVQTIIMTFIYLSNLFIVQNFKKILTADLELWGCAIFGTEMVHLPQTVFFWGKIINTILIYLFTPSIVPNFKKILMADLELWGCTIFGTKLADLPKWEFFFFFFRKPVNKPCSFHSCPSTRQKSKSDINLLLRYWGLKNTEISLATSHFWL